MLGAMHYVYNDKSLISDGPYPTSVFLVSVNELAVEYSTKQHLVVQATQSFQVVVFFALQCTIAWIPK